MANIRDIAKITGYSVSTVSRAINNKLRISKSTREKILSVAKELDYIQNSKAVSLSIGKSYVLGIIVPYATSNSYYDKIISSIISESFKNGYRVTFLPTNYDKDIEISYLRMLSAKEYDGMIITSATNNYYEIEKYLKYGPIVSCEDTKNTTVSSVVLERGQAYRPILEKLKEIGVERVGVTFSREPESSIGSSEVYGVFQNMIGDFSKEFTFPNCRNYDDGIKAAEYFETSKREVDCIFANSDEIAAGVFEYYKKNTKNIPIIIGQDNLPISRAMNLPSIDFKLHSLGSEAVRLCLSGEKKKITLRSEFIDRNIFN